MTTMIADPHAKTTMGVGFDAEPQPHVQSRGLERAIGMKPVAARLGLSAAGFRNPAGPHRNQRWEPTGDLAIRVY